MQDALTCRCEHKALLWKKQGNKMNAEITNRFIQAWEAKDLEAILSFFTDDAVYTNIPMGPPNNGIAEIRAFIESFLSNVVSMKFDVHFQIEGTDGIVMNERTDTLDFGGNVVDLPVMGIYEFKDGKICAWRDYFDMAKFSS